MEDQDVWSVPDGSGVQQLVYQTQAGVGAAAGRAEGSQKDPLGWVGHWWPQTCSRLTVDPLACVPVGVVVDQDVEGVGVAVSFTDEALDSSLSTVIHLYDVTLSFLLGHTPLV